MTSSQQRTKKPYMKSRLNEAGRRRGAEGSSLLIEAELQELISEERARQMAREAAAVRHGPG